MSSTTRPDIYITDDDDFKKEKKRLVTWEEFAAELFPKLQSQFPKMRSVTLAEFVRECPYKFEIIDDSDSDE